MEITKDYLGKSFIYKDTRSSYQGYSGYSGYNSSVIPEYEESLKIIDKRGKDVRKEKARIIDIKEKPIESYSQAKIEKVSLNGEYVLVICGLENTHGYIGGYWLHKDDVFKKFQFVDWVE